MDAVLFCLLYLNIYISLLWQIPYGETVMQLCAIQIILKFIFNENPHKVKNGSQVFIISGAVGKIWEGNDTSVTTIQIW